MKMDYIYNGIPWRDGGRTRAEGVDCAGLAALWLNEQLGLQIQPPETTPEMDCVTVLKEHGKPYGENLERGDLVFFRYGSDVKVRHVAVYLGDNRYLHTLNGFQSRTDIGYTLMRRVKLAPVGAISHRNAEAVALALNDPVIKDGGWGIALFIISIALSAASAFLMPKPKLALQRNQSGVYGFDQLITQASPQIPLPDVLGAVAIAGNSPYSEPIDKSQSVTDPTQQKINKVVILAGGPIWDTTYNGSTILINNIAYNDPYFHPSGGLVLNPTQDEANAVMGNIGTDSNRPSVTFYPGTPGITVPVDIRANYDRNFPVYGFNGCAYFAFRLINSTLYPQFNMIVRISGRLCRQFDNNGFITTAVVAEQTAAGDGTTVRFKLANIDIAAVTAVTVNGTAYTLMSASNQTGNVYWLNKTKGYLEFDTAPAGGATILVTYSFYPRAWTRNNASHLVYLYTEPIRGKGLNASQIDWARAVTLRDYCDGLVFWSSSDRSVMEPRYQCDYSIDYRQPIQDHIQAVLDGCYAYAFLSNGKVVLRPRGADTAVFDFNESNILVLNNNPEQTAKSSFSSEDIDRSTQFNQVAIFYHDAGLYNAETGITRNDENDQRLCADAAGNLGINDTTLHMPAVTSQTQAERIGEQILREYVNTEWISELTTNIQGLALEPGDLVTVTHHSQPTWAQKQMRIEELSLDDQDRLTLKVSEYFAGAYI